MSLFPAPARSPTLTVMLMGFLAAKRFAPALEFNPRTWSACVLALVCGGFGSGCGSEENEGAEAMLMPSSAGGTSVAGAANTPPTSTPASPTSMGGNPPVVPPMGEAPAAGTGPGPGGAPPGMMPDGATGQSGAQAGAEGEGEAGQSNGSGGEGGAGSNPSAGGSVGTEIGDAQTSEDTETTSETPPASSAARSPGCSSPPGLESGRHAIDVNGTEREYIIALPQDYDPDRAYRLVFAWHPLGGSAQQVAGMGQGGYYGLSGEADGSAIFVAPEGLPFSGNNLGWGNNDGRDIAFLDAMYEHFRQQLCFDEAQVFSTGFSFGGMMSFAVGCARGEIFRAIAPMAGNIAVSGCEPGDLPVAVMGFHGESDTVVSISGGRAGRDVFVERNGCSETAEPLEPSWCDALGQDRQPCSCVSYTGCDDGYPVIWCEFNGPHTPAPNSAATIWSFFTQFSEE